MTTPSKWRRPFARGLALLLAVATLHSARHAYSAPADIFSIPAPMIGASPPKSSDLKDGDASVATQTGAFQYGYPIQVPPGRNGMSPQLSLSYSSQAATFGGIAAGWTLSIPEIREDHSKGRLRTRAPEIEVQQAGVSYKDDDRFVSSLAGGRPLVLVTEPTGVGSGVYATYRAQNDTSFTRYERMHDSQPFRWRARMTDGQIATFGAAAHGDGCVFTDQYAPLTELVDAYGNAVSYFYEEGVDDECVLDRIEWGHNANAQITTAFAKVELQYTRALGTCGGLIPNTQIDFRTGVRVVSGASRLDKIVAYAIDQATGAALHTREVSLDYDSNAATCGNAHAPLRLLTSIQERAWGTDAPLAELPPITFEYNGAAVSLVTPSTTPGGPPPWFGLSSQPPGQTGVTGHLGWGYRRTNGRPPSVEAMFLDLDGDGLLDYLVNNSIQNNAIGECSALWFRNRGADSAGWPQFDATGRSIWLPRLKWRGNQPDPSLPAAVPGSPTAHRGSPYFESCSLAGQLTAFQNSTNTWPANLCHGSSALPCQADSNPLTDETFCYPGGTQCPTGAGGTNPIQHTNLAYRWMDMDGDALPDLVAAAHGNIEWYDLGVGSLPNHWSGEPTISGIPAHNAWPACPGASEAPEQCKALGDCLDIEDAQNCDGSGPCSTDYTDVINCLASAPTESCAGMMFKTPGNVPPSSQDPYGQAQPPTPKPYSRCEGLYPWLIYRNQGNGVFATTPIIKYQPVPLESESGDSSFGGPGIASTNHAIQDFDGDGILDAILRPVEAWNSPNVWFVWLGDGTGGFGPKRYVIPTRRGDANGPANGWGDNAISAVGHNLGLSGFSSIGMADLNGDSLPDHWEALPDGSTPGDAIANVAYSDGARVRLFPLNGGSQPPVGEYTTPSSSKVKPGSDTWVSVTAPSMPPAGPVENGTTSTRNRVLDVDHDGRPDVVRWPSGDSPTVFFNVGGQFITPGVPYAGDKLGLQRNTTAHKFGNAGDIEWLTWRLEGDLRDLNGDGVDEGHYMTEDGYIVAQPVSPSPRRLMSQITNGSGASTTVEYAHMHEPGVVEQSPDLEWPDGHRKASPRTQWVVKSLSTTDALANTAATTTYAYKHPRFAPDDEGTFAFRGFEEVTATGESGARTVERYGFDVDWSGRRVATLVQPSLSEGTAAEVRSISITKWKSFSILDGAITTYHPTVAEQLTCSNGQTETTCTPSGAAGYTRTSTDWAPYPLAAAAEDQVAVVETRTLRQADASLSLKDGDRETLTTYQLDNTLNGYQLHPHEVTRNHRDGSAWHLYAKSRQTWHSTYGSKLTEEIWSQANQTSGHATRWQYDYTTGNVVKRWKPKQNAGNQAHASFTYDSRKLFVATETNELGHVVSHVREYGTGTTLRTDGPNARTCTGGPPGCPTVSATHPALERHRVRIDGLGRVIERYATVDDGGYYTEHLVETNTYADTYVSNSAPRSVLNQVLKTVGQSDWIKKRSEYDGLGRVLRETTYAQGSAPADAITTYGFDDDGTLETVTVPDPTSGGTATVTYTYDFDSLGRPISLRRPDHASNASGINMSYDGLQTSTVEVVGTDGGNPAETNTISDDYGRLIEVKESIDGSSFALTQYAYGPDDLVRDIKDPEGNSTLLEHDLAGRRTRITRANRTWEYKYDANGNVEAELAPPPDPNDSLLVALWTSTYVYDDLDRVTQKLVAPRDLSNADLDLFASNLDTFAWDGGPNGVSRLRQWSATGPSASSDLSATMSYDAQGRVTLTEHDFNQIAGLPQLQRSLGKTWHIFGGEASTEYFDNQFGGTSTVSEMDHDARGLPLRFRVGSAAIGEQTRNVAGLVTQRRTNTGSSAYVQSQWTYDRLGRVAEQQVTSHKGEVATQELTYFGNDDVATMKHVLGVSERHFTFAYDHRHQLTEANDDDGPYFTGGYEYSRAGRLARLKHERTLGTPPDGADLKPRDVDYEYGGDDPEQVTALLYKGTSLPFATYSYDSAGNQAERLLLEEDDQLYYTYDGNNQLRRVVRKHKGAHVGSEEYWYLNGQRSHVLKRDKDGDKTGLVWFIGDVEAHYDGSANVTKVYSHLSMGTPVARIERTGATTTNIEYQFHGLANHTLAAVDAGGSTNAGFIYAPFGEVLEGLEDNDVTHRRRFNDKYQDEISGLNYYGARYYDKIASAWTQSDPKYRFAPDSASASPRRSLLYTANLNNSMRYLDPDGLDIVLVGRAQDPDLGLTLPQTERAARRSGSFTTMSRTTKSSRVVASAAQMKRALAGRSDDKVAYFGHGRLDSRELDPSGTQNNSVSPAQFADAVNGMRRQPTDIYLYGCNTEDTGFAEELSNLLPGVTVHGYAGELQVDATGPVENGRPNRNRAVINPRNPGAETSHRVDASEKNSHKPADADGNGKVTDQEESDWMRSQQ